jgi:hypothetical protein
MGARLRDLLDDARTFDLLAVLEIGLKHGMTRSGQGYLFNHFLNPPERARDTNPKAGRSSLPPAVQT